MENTIKKVSPLEESDQVPIEDVQLHRSWSFWENYEQRQRIEKQNYGHLLKKINDFNTIIDFWQFWNHYPGNSPSNIFFNGERMRYFFKEKYRISAMNLFCHGISPEWEDVKNQKGKTIVMEYIIQSDLNLFMSLVEKAWEKLMLYLLGESLIHAQYINGIRFVDKTQMEKGKKIMFRFEIWVNSKCPSKELEELKKTLGNEFGCGGITVKDIIVQNK